MTGPASDTVDLKEFFERWLQEMDRRYEQRFQAQERAVRVAVEVHDRQLRVGVAVLAGLQLVLHFLH